MSLSVNEELCKVPFDTWVLSIVRILRTELLIKGFDMNNNIGKFLDERFRKENPDYFKDPSIKWNFTKFLIDRQGHVIDRFEPTADMKDVEAGIKAALRMK